LNSTFIRKFGAGGFFVGVLLTAVSLPLWNLGMSLGQFIMAGGWLIAGNLPERLRNATRQPVFFFLIGLYLLHLAGLWNTEDMVYATKDLRVKLPLLLMPLLLIAGPPLTARQYRITLAAVLTGVLISSGVGYATYMGWTGKLVNNYRDISLFISHIRLSLLIDFCLVICCLAFLREESKLLRVVCIVTMIWLGGFLILLQSVTGLAILLILIWLGLLLLVTKAKHFIVKITSGIASLAIVIVLWQTYQFLFVQSIEPVNISLQELPPATRLGNKYTHNTFRQDIEQGRLVWIQFHEAEMDSAWRQRGGTSLWETDQRGQMQLVTIMRFLTYRNYSKDYDGVMRLSNDDLQLIRNGYPTPEHYTEQNSLLFRFKELASEYRTYHFTGWATGQTLAQRFEYWKTARWIIAHHPLTGVGTGDVPNAYKDAYNATNSTLSDEWRLRAHNQYLSFGVAFGWPGMIYFIFVLAYALVTGIRKNDIVYLSFLLIAIASFFTEDTLETQAGVTFFAFLNALLLIRSTEEKS
jgi:hypothetical protein